MLRRRPDLSTDLGYSETYLWADMYHGIGWEHISLCERNSWGGAKDAGAHHSNEMRRVECHLLDAANRDQR